MRNLIRPTAPKQESKVAGKLDDLDVPKRPARPAAQFAVPIRTDLSRPSTSTSEPAKEAGSASVAPRLETVEPRTMIVGQGIVLSGDIKSCNRLVAEGTLDAKLHAGRQLEIAEHGTFKGNATVEQCEVSGHFEGELVVSKRLFIRSAGHVSGTISYGQIEVERGGKLSGTVKANENGSAIAGFGVLQAGE